MISGINLASLASGYLGTLLKTCFIFLILIGHGIYTVRDDDIVALAREKDVLFELCPISNWLTSSIPSLCVYPIREFMKSGLSVSINSDDPGLFASDLCAEYEVLEKHLDFTEEEFNRINDVAAARSFYRGRKDKLYGPAPSPSDPETALVQCAMSRESSLAYRLN